VIQSPQIAAITTLVMGWLERLSHAADKDKNYPKVYKKFKPFLVVTIDKSTSY